MVVILNFSISVSFCYSCKLKYYSIKDQLCLFFQSCYLSDFIRQQKKFNFIRANNLVKTTTTTTPKTTIFQTNFDNTNFERSRTSSLITTPPPPSSFTCQGLKGINNLLYIVKWFHFEIKNFERSKFEPSNVTCKYIFYVFIPQIKILLKTF